MSETRVKNELSCGEQSERVLAANHLEIRNGRLFFADLDEPSEPYLHELKSVIANDRSPYQHIQIFDTVRYGKMLALDGSPQLSIADGFMYTELLAGVPMLCHPNPERICILGGGDGAATALVLKDPRVKSVILVDIDEAVMRLTQKEIPEFWESSQKNPKLQIKTTDAIEYLKNSPDQFDIIIVDLTDPNEGSQSTRLVSPEFFTLIGAHLDPDGMITINAGQLLRDRSLDHGNFKRLVVDYTLQKKGRVYSYAAYIPSFSLPWSFILGSRRHIQELRSHEKVFTLFDRADRLIYLCFKYLTPITFIGALSVDTHTPYLL